MSGIPINFSTVISVLLGNRQELCEMSTCGTKDVPTKKGKITFVNSDVGDGFHKTVKEISDKARVRQRILENGACSTPSSKK